jgi:hypothetical protein
MGKHRAGRTAGIGPRRGTTARADGPDEPRGRLFDQSDTEGPVSVSQVMAILELIAERRAQHVGSALGLADRIQSLA